MVTSVENSCHQSMSCSEVWASVLAALCTAKLGDCQKLGKTAHKKAGPIASVLAAWCTAMLGDCQKKFAKKFHNKRKTHHFCAAYIVQESLGIFFILEKKFHQKARPIAYH